MFARTPRRTRIRCQSCQALTLAAEVENLAHQYVVVRSLGTPRLISDDEMDRIVEKFKTYGHQIKEQK